MILDGRPRVKHEGSLDGMPLQAPWVDVRSIGAGGGSLAYVDEGGLLRVGPGSAGASPGPACYGRGGERATVTDAAAHLGMLAHGQLAGGLALALPAASQSLAPLAQTLGLGLDDVARGILKIANAHMAEAIRSVALEQGEDLRDATLVAFGGAGPLFATLLAEELDMPRVVIPAHAGNFSAWALLSQDITRAVAVTFVTSLEDEFLPAISARLRDLGERLADEARGDDDVSLSAALDLRYRGQEYTLTIPVAASGGVLAGDAAAIADAFHVTYERTFGHRLDVPVELVVVRLAQTTPLPARTAAPRAATLPVDVSAGTTIEAFSCRLGERLPFRILPRARLRVGECLEGPLIMIEETATTYVDSGFSVELEASSGALILSREERP